MSLIKYPYTNLHELNLDWIIEQLNNQDGPVRSVNGKTGIVSLTGEDMARSSNDPETVAAALTAQGTSIQTVRNQIGVTPLPTTAQTLTGAITENAQEIADVEDNVIGSTALPTVAQTLTGAIAENTTTIGNNGNNITSINNKIGSTALPTTAQTLTGAIAENAQEISDVEDNVIGNTALPTTAQTLTGAIAELNNKFTSLYGTVTTGVQYEICANTVTIYLNGVTVAGSTGWTKLADLPSGLDTRYSAHFKAMSGQDIQIAGSAINYRGSAGDIFGACTYVRG